MKRTFMALQREEARIMLWSALQQRFKKPVLQASLGLVGTLLLIAALGVLVLRPTLLTISSLIKEIQDEEKLVVALDNKFRALTTVGGLLEEMKQDLPRIDWAVPHDHEFEIFAKEVEILAKEKRLAAVEISQAGFDLVGENTGSGGERFLEVGVTVDGSEEAVRDFLADLIRMDRLVVVKSVNASSVPKEEGREEPYRVRLTATMEILWE